jgi:hypothetical protein
MLGDENCDLDDNYLRVPGVTNLVAFGLGVVSLGLGFATHVFEIIGGRSRTRTYDPLIKSPATS